MNAILDSDDSNELSEVIRNYWQGLITKNETLRFSKQSKDVFSFLKKSI